MAKPTDLPRWADVSGDIVEPPEGDKDTGWVPEFKPPAQWFNWWMNLVYAWTVWLDAFESTVHDWSAAQSYSAPVTFGDDVTFNTGFTTVPGTTAEFQGRAVFVDEVIVSGSEAVLLSQNQDLFGWIRRVVTGQLRTPIWESVDDAGGSIGVRAYHAPAAGFEAKDRLELVVNAKWDPGDEEWVRDSAGAPMFRLLLTTGGLHLQRYSDVGTEIPESEDVLGDWSTIATFGTGAFNGDATEIRQDLIARQIQSETITAEGLPGDRGGEFTGGNGASGLRARGGATGGTGAEFEAQAGGSAGSVSRGAAGGLGAVGIGNGAAGGRFSRTDSTSEVVAEFQGAVRFTGDAPASTAALERRLTELLFPKAIVMFTLNGTANPDVEWGQNVTSVSQASNGEITVTWAQDFLDDMYIAEGEIVAVTVGGGTHKLVPKSGGRAAGSCVFQIIAGDVGYSAALVDRATSDTLVFGIKAWGPQAP